VTFPPPLEPTSYQRPPTFFSFFYERTRLFFPFFPRGDTLPFSMDGPPTAFFGLETGGLTPLSFLFPELTKFPPPFPPHWQMSNFFSKRFGTFFLQKGKWASFFFFFFPRRGPHFLFSPPGKTPPFFRADASPPSPHSSLHAGRRSVFFPANPVPFPPFHQFRPFFFRGPLYSPLSFFFFL